MIQRMNKNTIYMQIVYSLQALNRETKQQYPSPS